MQEGVHRNHDNVCAEKIFPIQYGIIHIVEENFSLTYGLLAQVVEHMTFNHVVWGFESPRDHFSVKALTL